MRLIDRLRRLDSVPGDVDVHRLLLDVASPSELDWSDFDHVAEARDHVESILKGALRTGALGVNILVYGPPGTGKTEFCKTLSARLEVKLYSVGESDEHGGEPSRNERLQELRLTQRLLAPGHESILLFDEMEDLLADQGVGRVLKLFGLPGPRGQGSKVFIHRLLEQTPVPTLWTANDVRAISQTVLSRTMFAMELRQPTERVRARIWARQLAHHGIESGEEEARALATEFDVTPGVASGATDAARLSGGGLTAVRRGVRSLARVLSAEKPPQGTPEKFDPTLISANGDPVRFAERLVESGKRRFSLCLQGPPGKGKSVYVRYLAERLGLEVVQKRASDLMSCFVGNRTTDCRGLRRGARRGIVSGVRRSRLLARRPALRRADVGSEPSQRNADLDGNPPPAVRLHDQLRRTPGRRDAPALHLQDRVRLPHPRAGNGRVPHLFRPDALGGSRNPHDPDPGRLRRRAPKSRNPQPLAVPKGTRRHATHGIRSQTQQIAKNRLPVVSFTGRDKLSLFPLPWRERARVRGKGRADHEVLNGLYVLGAASPKPQPVVAETRRGHPLGISVGSFEFHDWAP